MKTRITRTLSKENPRKLVTNQLNSFLTRIRDPVASNIRSPLTTYPRIQKFLIEALDICPSITSGFMGQSRQVIKEIDESN